MDTRYVETMSLVIRPVNTEN